MAIVADVIFCDDIRQEMTGKFILIGMYPTDLVPGTVPSTSLISVMVRVRGVPAGEHDFVFSLDAPNRSRSMEHTGRVAFPDKNQPLVLIFAGIPVLLDRAGEIVASLEISEKRLTVGKLPVIMPPGTAKSD